MSDIIFLLRVFRYIFSIIVGKTYIYKYTYLIW